MFDAVSYSLFVCIPLPAKGNGGTPVAAIGAEILMVLVTLAVVAVQT